MRKSSAPSQLNKRRATFFSPPYKNPVPASKRQCAILPCTDEPLNEGNQKRSSSELLTLIKTPTVADKENEPKNTSLPHINKVECTREMINNKFSNTFSSPIPHQSVLRKGDHSDEENVTRYFSVVWCKLSKKKHKNWEGDAVLIVKGRSVILKDMEGKEIGRTSSIKLKDLESLVEGNTLPIGAKEVEIQNEISSQNYLSGKCFQNSIEETPVETTVPLPPKSKPFRLPYAKNSLNQDKLGEIIKPLYNPCHVNAFVLPKPPAHHQWSCNVESLPVVDVVVDPQIAHHLRPHQKAGVIFLYESAMGYRIKDHKGAILADEMGLGKTLQCIALLWTLLKQGPYGGRPVLKRVIIVTPSSLVSNWGKEFNKWLGKEKIAPFIVDQQNKVEDFLIQNRTPILIISYEMLVRSIDKVQRGKFDLVLCDEGHRLKNCQIKTTSTLMSLEIKRRIIVTGTPIQNDLQELYSLIEFVNPGILGSSAMFRKVYEEPILKSQQPSATKEEKDIGESRALELNRLACQFTLRRTQEIINKYLPPKTEFVVFCQPSSCQIKLYNDIVGSRGLKKCLTNTEVGDHLSAICVLRKLCNHPALLHSSETKENQSEIRNEIASLIPNEILPNNYLEEDSGKLAVVSCLLWSLFETKKERIVIVSNFTTTLDMLENLCKRYSYAFLRLDGSTPSSKRQNIVDRFNSPYCKELVFLLSSKAGGVGLNLIGASRILLFDIDWNPATDLQAMSRVWRDGQTKSVYIYRLILAGSIEEKMFQRQVCKQGISGSVVDARSSFKVQFSREDLKDLFRFHPSVASLTHDLLNCPCDQKGGESKPLSQGSQTEERDCQLVREAKSSDNSATMDQLFRWQHFSMPEATELLDDAFLESGSDFISFIFKYQVMPENVISIQKELSTVTIPDLFFDSVGNIF
ncbi:UNVERIFIED_CONTAM: hypothetical protein RMT77_010391 [Armadillidium vulgare]